MTASSAPPATAKAPGPTSIVDLDRSLAAHPDFGDGAAIERRCLQRLRGGLLSLGHRVPVLAGVAPRIAADDRALLAILGDPVLRGAFELDHGALTRRWPNRATALAGYLPTVELSAHGPCQRLAQPPRSAWPAHGPAWVWTSVDATTGPIAARLCDLARDAIGALPLLPTEHELGALRRGADLLAELLPGVGGTALRHVRLVCITRQRRVPGDGGIPGALFIAAPRLNSASDTARTILREGSRLAILEVERCTPLAATGAPAGRAALALHRSLHMALFAAAAGTGGRHVRLSRARHLATQLAASGPHLTPHGRRLVQHLTAAITTLSPPP